MRWAICSSTSCFLLRENDDFSKLPQPRLAPRDFGRWISRHFSLQPLYCSENSSHALQSCVASSHFHRFRVPRSGMIG